MVAHGVSPAGLWPGLPNLRMRVLLPSTLLLAGMLLVLGLLGFSWFQSQSEQLGRSRVDALGRALQLAVEPLAASESPAVQEATLHHALDSEPLLAFANLEVGGRSWLVLRQDPEGGRLQAESTALQQALAVSTTGSVVHVAHSAMVISRTRGAGATLTLGLSLGRQRAEMHGHIITLFSSLALVMFVYGVVLLALLNGFTRRVEQLAASAQRVAEGDLRARVGGAADDALGVVGRAIDAAAERLTSVQGQIRGAATELGRSARDVAEAADQVRRGTAGQVSDIDEATQAARDLIQAQGTAVRQSESLRDETRLTAGVAQRLATVSQETAAGIEDAERLASATSEAARAIHASIIDVARQTGALSETTVQTTGAMQEVRHAITRVRELATNGANLAENASLDAERGAAVLENSMHGIEAIREASRAISGVTDGLQLRVGEIGNVLHLITELTQRTNLLALNASIIAAQAGAEGRGFAVVADEIKDLARRTANSAGNIDSLIQAVAEGAHAARRTAIAGNEAVEIGATQSREAARTLSEILSRLRTSAANAKSIAAATDDQARSTGQVLRSLQDLQNQTMEMASKATEQSRRGEFLQRHATRLAEVVEALGTAGQELREGSAQVADTLTRMARTVEELSASQRSRVADGERVRGMLEIARRIATGHREAVALLDRAVTDLKGLAETIGDELRDPRG